MMKSRLLSTILIICLLFSSVGVFASDNNQNIGQINNISIQGVFETIKGITDLVNNLIQKFSDLKDHWAVEYVATLMEKGSISGYTDGTFKPNGNITRAEFTKIMITSLGSDPGNSTAGHWAMNYINDAISEGYLTKNEFQDLNQAINRAEMARMISRAMNETPQNIEKLKNQLTDFGQIGSAYKDHIAKVYAAGIITGYPDGTFKPNGTATRAEASTMLVRLLEPSKRKIPEIKKEDKNFIKPDLYVQYNTQPFAYDYFNIMVKNWDEFTDAKEEYVFKTECVSHPEINETNWRKLEPGYNEKVGDMIEQSIITSKTHRPTGGYIYGLFDFRMWKPSISDRPFAPKEGEKMEYKITVTKDNSTIKEYYLEFKFKYKEFGI